MVSDKNKIQHLGTSAFSSASRSMQHYLWLAIMVGVVLFASIIFSRQVPENLQRGEMGQAAIKLLDAMRRPLFAIKALQSQVATNSNSSIAVTKLEQSAQDVERMIAHYRQQANYNPELVHDIDQFSTAYHQWINAERHIIDHHNEQNESPTIQHMARHILEANRLFLTTMGRLGKGETPIHEDIYRGRQAVHLLQWSGAVLVIYLFVVVLLYQRFVGRFIANSEEGLRITLQSIGDAVIVTDIQGRIVRMNPVAEKLTGWSLSEAAGCQLTKILRITSVSNDDPIQDPVANILRQGGCVELADHAMLIARDGTHYQISDSGAPVRNTEGEIVGAVLIFRDISASHNLQRSIEEHSLRLQRIIESAPDAVIVADETGAILEWNPHAETIFGWLRDEIVGCLLHETIIPPQHRDTHLEGIKNYIQMEMPKMLDQRMEIHARHKDGHTFPIELTVTRLHQSNGWLFAAFIRDLTEKKATEQSLRRHEALLAEAQRIAHLGYWELDLQTNHLEWSDEIYHIFGLEPSQFDATYEAFINAVHPDDRKLVSTAYSESLAKRAPYDIVHRVLLKDGALKYVHEICETSYDEKGIPVRSIGTVQDVSARIKAEEELRLAATTFDTHAGILITDRQGTILRVNPRFEEMTGYSRDELIGQNPRILHSERQDSKFYELMWSTLKETGQWQGELWNKRKDGSLYAEWLTITAVRNEVGELTHYVGTSQDISKRKQAEARIEHLAYYDDLTGLANRRLLRDRLQQEMAVAKRHGVYGSLLFIDLDQFKHLNDSLGHPIGDELLRQVAGRLQQLVRTEDTVARLGGDEFVLILPAQHKALTQVGYEAQSVAEKVRVQLSAPYNLEDHQYQMSASVGIVLFPEGEENADDVLKHADAALYRAKEEGRDTVRFYQPSMQTAADNRLRLEKDLRIALEQQQFQLYYQPQLDSAGRITGAEALLRWLHPEHGMVPPDNFIPVAEGMGLILEIGNWVLRAAMKQMSAWRNAGFCASMRHLAINVSPKQFHQADFVALVLHICQQAGIPPDCIELEITESIVMDNIEETIEKMAQLREVGMRFSIDDFGTGYSSLSYLKRLPLDQLKIDQSFVRDIVSNANDAAIVDTIIAMTCHLGLGVIAEGVETGEQLAFLEKRGCQAFQGYYFSRPVPADEFSVLLRGGRLPT